MDKKRIHEMLEILTGTALGELHKGTECVCTEEMGQVIGMIKELTEAEKNVWEKCYWEALAESIEEEEELESLLFKEGRAGYDRWRTSHGRFAPKGHGHETSMAMARGRAGFDGPWPNPPYYDDPRMWDGMDPNYRVMGYDRLSRDHDRRDTSWPHTSDGQSSHTTGRMGYTPDDYPKKETSYDRYQEARKHFHETGAPEHRQEMSEHAKKYVGDTLVTVKSIFEESDPELQKRIKDDITRLYREFGGK